MSAPEPAAPPASDADLPELPPIDAAPSRPASVLAAARLGFALALRRLAARRTALAFLLALALAVAAAIIEVSVSAAGAVDRSLHATFRLVVPLLAFALSADAAGRDHLRDATWPVARFGAARRDVALGVIAAAALIAAAAGATLAVVAVVVAHTPSAPPLARDALVSAWIGALAGASYAGWYALGGTFLRRGYGRTLPLAADFLLGGSGSLAGAVLPSGNVANLLGGRAPLGLTQPASAGLLALAALLLSLAAALRCRD